MARKFRVYGDIIMGPRNLALGSHRDARRGFGHSRLFKNHAVTPVVETWVETISSATHRGTSEAIQTTN